LLVYYDGMRNPLKRWPILLALLITFGVLAVGFVCLPHGTRVTRANCDRIKEGMTKDEVFAILGKPWDDSLLDLDPPSMKVMNKGGTSWAIMHELLLQAPDNGPGQYLACSLWVGQEAVVYVVFEDGRVTSTKVFMDPDRPLSWLTTRVGRRLRARSGL
jgi:hypothetical protein